MGAKTAAAANAGGGNTLLGHVMRDTISLYEVSRAHQRQYAGAAAIEPQPLTVCPHRIQTVAAAWGEQGQLGRLYNARAWCRDGVNVVEALAVGLDAEEIGIGAQILRKPKSLDGALKLQARLDPCL
eukprot:scaffold43527_cov55-Phaeocystis_antarctica.AAC.5